MVIIDFLVVGPVSPRAKVPLPGTGPCRSQSYHGARLGGSVYTRNAMARLPLTQQEGPTETKPKGAPGRAVSVDTENLRLAQANPKEEPLQQAVSPDTSSGQTPQKSGVGQAPLALSCGVEGSEPSTGQPKEEPLQRTVSPDTGELCQVVSQAGFSSTGTGALRD